MKLTTTVVREENFRFNPFTVNTSLYFATELEARTYVIELRQDIEQCDNASVRALIRRIDTVIEKELIDQNS